MSLKVRDSNIELLRIIAILGVTVLHYNGVVAFALVTPGTVNEWFLQGMEALFICAVDLFILISGYFSCTTNRRKAVKVFELLFQVSVLSFGWYLLSSVLFHTPITLYRIFVSLVPNSYFVTIYLTLYVFSPYLNRAIAGLSEKKFRTLLALCFLLFSLWPTVLDMAGVYGHSLAGLYPMSFSGSAYGYTFVQFAFMYLVGAYLRRFSPEGKILGKPWVWICVFLVSLVIVFLWQFLAPWVARSYCNPFVILLAVAVFLLFRSFSFQSRAVNLLAKGTFTAFLLHAVFLPYIGIEKVVNGNVLLLAAHMVLSTVVIYLICWVVWFIYDFVSRPVRKLAGKILAPLDGALSLEQSEEAGKE